MVQCKSLHKPEYFRSKQASNPHVTVGMADELIVSTISAYLYAIHKEVVGRPRWLSWMRRPTRDQEVAGSTPAEVGNILSWRLIMKYFLRSFSPFRWFKKDSCQFLAKECAQYWLTA